MEATILADTGGHGHGRRGASAPAGRHALRSGKIKPLGPLGAGGGAPPARLLVFSLSAGANVHGSSAGEKAAGAPLEANASACAALRNPCVDTADGSATSRSTTDAGRSPAASRALAMRREFGFTCGVTGFPGVQRREHAHARG